MDSPGFNRRQPEMPILRRGPRASLGCGLSGTILPEYCMVWSQLVGVDQVQILRPIVMDHVAQLGRLPVDFSNFGREQGAMMPNNYLTGHTHSCPRIN